MTERNYFQCTACDCRVITRTAIGHSSSQSFTFACPSCGVELHFLMRIKPEVLGWEYLDLTNLQEVAPDESIQFRFDLDPETLVRKQIVGRPTIEHTAWMHMHLLVKDRAEYENVRNMRLGALRQFRPVLDRAVTYLLKNNLPKLRSELASIEADPGHSSLEARVKLFNSLEQYGSLFAPELVPNRHFAWDAVKKAMNSHETEADKLCDYFAAAGRIDSLFTQTQNISKKWSELYPMISGLDIIPYLREPKPNIESEYTLAQKRFSELKGLFVDCFETLCRISVIAAVFDGINSSGKAEVAGSKRSLTIQEFDALKNGSKSDLLKNLPCGHLFTSCLDHSLRNGIGHHDAQYSLVEDTVHYANTSPKRGVERFSMPYVSFCQKVADIARLLDAVTFYVYFVWSRTR